MCLPWYTLPAAMPPPGPDDPISICAGCGGKNPASAGECDWCGRPFVSKGGRLRLTIWQIVSSLLLLGLIGFVAAVAILNAGRSLPPVRGSATGTAAPTVAPAPAVTPRVTAPLGATATAVPAAAAPNEPTPLPTAPPPTPEPTATPQLPVALVVNTAGQGVTVRLQPGPQAPRAGVLREGTRVFLTGNDQTVAARPWREVETQDHTLKGWVEGDFLQATQPAP